LIGDAQNRYPASDRSWQLLRREAETHNLHSSIRLPLDTLNELLSSRRTASNDHMPGDPALRLHPALQLPGKETNHKAQDDRSRRADDKRAE
jgi:hypothetical protein